MRGTRLPVKGEKCKCRLARRESSGPSICLSAARGISQREKSSQTLTKEQAHAFRTRMHRPATPLFLWFREVFLHECMRFSDFFDVSRVDVRHDAFYKDLNITCGLEKMVAYNPKVPFISSKLPRTLGA